MIIDRVSSWTRIVRQLADPKTEDQDRWLLRVSLLELAGVEPSTEALASLAGTTPEHVMGAMAVLRTEGLVEFRKQ